MGYLKRLKTSGSVSLEAFKMYYVMRASAPSLHRESTDSLIFIINDRIMFNVETLCFNDHLQAYTIKPTSNSKLILQSKLVYPSPMHIHRVAHNTTQSVIVCKHHICHMIQYYMACEDN